MPGRSAGSQGSPVLLRQAQARTLTHARRECRCVHAAAPTTAHARVDTPGDVFAHAVTGAAHLRSVERGHEQHADSEPHAPRAGAHATRQAARVPLRPMMWWQTPLSTFKVSSLPCLLRGETGRRECSNAALQLVIYLPRAAKTMCMAKGLILRHGNGMRARPVLRQQHILPSSSRSWPNTVRLDSDSAHLANFEAAPP